MNTLKAYVIGTYDTKGKELDFVKKCLATQGIPTVTVDVSTQKHPNSDFPIDIQAETVFPKVFETKYGSRGDAISRMSTALEAFLLTRDDIGGVIGLGGSGGTSLVSQAMQALPVGLPRIMVSTMASGDVRPYVGANDIYMVYSISDIKGINAISNSILRNAADALGGMISNLTPAYENTLDSIGITMFGVTTPCVNTIVEKLEKSFEPLVYHATGVGGQSMEK